MQWHCKLHLERAFQRYPSSIHYWQHRKRPDSSVRLAESRRGIELQDSKPRNPVVSPKPSMGSISDNPICITDNFIQNLSYNFPYIRCIVLINDYRHTIGATIVLAFIIWTYSFSGLLISCQTSLLYKLYSIF